MTTADAVGPIAAVVAVAAAAHAARPSPGYRASRPPSVRGPRPTATLSRRRRERAVEALLPDAIDLLVLAVRSGHLPTAAMGAVAPFVGAPIREAFETVVAQVGDGTRFADSLRILPVVLGPRASALADSFAAADRDGLPLAPVLERLAEEARQQRRRRADTLARQLPIRLAIPLVLCTLPSFVLLTIAPLLLAALTSLHR